MLIKLNEKFTEILSKKLRELSRNDKKNFHPHKFDFESIKNLFKGKGNHYYIYLDESGEFAGYGMLRTFGKYEIPTLGCIIWQEYREHGNGKKLVEELINKASGLKYQKIRLKVHPNNKIAYRLYKKVEFKETNENEDELIWMEYDEENVGKQYRYVKEGI